MGLRPEAGFMYGAWALTPEPELLMSETPSHDAWRPNPDPAGSFPPETAAPTASYGHPIASSQPIYAEPVGGVPGYTQTAPGLPGYGQPASVPPAYGQPAYGDPLAGRPGYGQYPPYGATPWAPPPRKRRTGVIVLVVATVLVVLCGGLVAVGFAVDFGRSASPSAADTPAAAATSPAAVTGTAAAIPDGDGNALKARLVLRPPGARILAVTGSTDGVLSLDQFVTVLFKGSPVAKTLLQGDGFEIAAEERWIAKGVETHAQLMQFQDADGPLAYDMSQHRAFTRDTKYTSHDLVGIPDGYAYELNGLDVAHNHRAILMAPAGPIFVVMFFYEPGPLDRDSELALMRQQIAALAS
jgi:hypothetical protein